MHEDVTAAWDRVVEQWDDAARHDAFFTLVVQHSSFAWAAARYKERGDDPVAHKQLVRLTKAATATMLATATQRAPEPPSPYKKTMMWLVVMTVMLLLGLVFTRIVASHVKPKPPTPSRHPTPARH